LQNFSRGVNSPRLASPEEDDDQAITITIGGKKGGDKSNKSTKDTESQPLLKKRGSKENKDGTDGPGNAGSPV
jgi:hypothetical protein